MGKKNLQRSFTAKALGLLLALVAVFACGCGTLNVDLHTTLKLNGDVQQEVRYTASGLMSSAVSSSMDPATLEADGWVVTTDTSSASSIVTISKTFKNGEDFTLTDSASADSPAVKDAQFRVKNYFFFKTFHIEGTLSGVSAADMGDLSSYGASVTPQMLDSMLHLTWAVTLPGRITDTNAPNKEGNTATWDFTYSSLQQDQHILVNATYIAWPAVLGLVALIIVLSAGVTLLVLRRRKPAQPAVNETPVTPVSP